MARKLNMVVRPSGALVHLSAMVDDSASQWPAGLGERLRRELCAELSRQHDELSLYARCVAWLERRRLVRVERARGRGTGEATPVWLCALTFKIDLDALCTQATQESAQERTHSSAKERAWVSCHALRRVLKFITQRGLIEVASLRAGKLRATATEALASFEALCAESGMSWGRGLPPVLGDERAERVERVERVEQAPPQKKAEKVEAKTEAKREPPKGEAPRVESPSAEKSKTEKPRSEKPKTETREKSAGSAGFGGLPDDAEPEDRRATEALSARGLTADAEFFLSETGIAEWPCDPATLSRARRSAVSRLHPDRAGDASATLFHRVIKGHVELLQKLSKFAEQPPTAATPVDKPASTAAVPSPAPSSSPASAPSPTPATQPTPAPAATVTQPPAKNSVCEWPPPPRPATAPTPSAPHATPRRTAPKARREARVVSL